MHFIPALYLELDHEFLLGKDTFKPRTLSQSS